MRKNDAQFNVEAYAQVGKAWVDRLVIDVARSRVQPEPDPLRAMLGVQISGSGGSHLRQCGRCLSWLDAGDLIDPIGVADDVRRLVKLLSVGDRRSVVLVGPPGSGKTARIEGAVRVRQGRTATRGQVWHLAPARLISGMSYLGQWQQRVQAILQYAHKLDHILYFDDLLGLYEAGKTRDSNMCVADMLRTQLEIRPVRVLAEMTSEAWSILQERDRGFAGRFIVMPTAALAPEQSMEILLGVRRQLEDRHRCTFAPDVIPELVSLYHRFERTSVLPGKAAAALGRLAIKSPRSPILQQDAVEEFRSRTGLNRSLINLNVKITRATLEDQIRQYVVGQDEPVSKLIDVVLMAAARMNDTSRPLGTFLLVGPTGVGKTQLAKAIAQCLFDEGGLIRLDMNELTSTTAGPRLIGTFDAPDGLLTSAVRRRPHAVLLLDEIEKAHPSVLDVLLQVLGEARLSDARGRTVDLSGLLILMTSNLGSRNSTRGRGFREAGDPVEIAQVHNQAVREYFRPEFFNRIDGVLNFERLSRATIQNIATIQVNEILRRDGILRRSVLVDIDPEAVIRTAHLGYSPALGARALKRRIEQDLIRPAARVLAATKSKDPLLLRLYLENNQVHVDCQPITLTTPSTLLVLPDAQEVTDWAAHELSILSDKIGNAPLRIELQHHQVAPEVLEQSALKNALREARDLLRDAIELQQRRRLSHPQATPIHGPRIGIPNDRFSEPRLRPSIKAVQAIDDIWDYLDESLEIPNETDADRLGWKLVDTVIKLQRLVESRGTPQELLLAFRWYGDSRKRTTFENELTSEQTLHRIVEQGVLDFLTKVEGFECESWETSAIRFAKVSGALVQEAVDVVAGGQMVLDAQGGMHILKIMVVPPDGPTQLTSTGLNASLDASLPVIRRVYRETGRHLDLRNNSCVLGNLDTQRIADLLCLGRRSHQRMPGAEMDS
jgi:ATP-dependent Clp protease ATP-binding subunit ClpA